jgi:hypothetical protein
LLMDQITQVALHVATTIIQELSVSYMAGKCYLKDKKHKRYFKFPCCNGNIYAKLILASTRSEPIYCPLEQ